MQDSILRRVWDFDVKEQAYRNMLAGQDSVFPGIAVFSEKWHSGGDKMNEEYSGMKKISLIALLILPFAGFAQDCFDRAGRDYHIEPDLLRAIAFRESSWRENAMNIVSQQKYAVGMMQIHSQNFSHLAQYGITPQHLYRDSCLNIYTGAYYLAIAFKRWGYNWRSVGAYNAGFKDSPEQERKRQKYAIDIQNIYRQIKFNTPPASPKAEKK